MDCLVDFDFQLIDLFKKMAGDQRKIKDRVLDEFYRISDELGRRPLLEPVAELAVVETFVTGDVREGRGGEKWLNVIGERS